jgi:hypothetical protein
MQDNFLLNITPFATVMESQVSARDTEAWKSVINTLKKKGA